MSRAIAIVAVAGRFPGAPDFDSLWAHVSARGVASVDISSRWPTPAQAVFDPAGGIDKTRAKAFCPIAPPANQSIPSSPTAISALTLELGLKAFAAAKSHGVNRERVGIIFGNIALPTDEASAWAEAVYLSGVERDTPSRDARVSVPAFETVAEPALLLRQALQLGGPAFTVDAACASSLYAIYLACLELESHRLDAVISGGVSLPQQLYTQIGFTQLQALSPTGRCAPFDSRADGLVVGEGGALFVLKRLADAVSQGDSILGVIRGVGVSNDTKGSLLSPDTDGQVRAMEAAFADAGWTPSQVDFVECHGTGTPRGDGVELLSLNRVYGPHHRAHPLRIGSVKSNVGHLLTGAGAAALSKVLGALQHAQIPPNANFSLQSAGATLQQTPFRVPEAVEPWPPPNGHPRRAAVSGFGFGGINAHLLIEAYAPNESDALYSSSTPIEASRLAVVGVGLQIGKATAIDELAALGQPPPLSGSGRHSDAESALLEESLGHVTGHVLSRIDFEQHQFKIPPNELTSILPQQLLVLKAALAAKRSLRSAWPEDSARVGAVIGLGLDWESTSFHLRWVLTGREAWPSATRSPSTEGLADSLSDPLNATRTLGALGGIVASRLAREMKCGGPSFTLSGDSASGRHALRTGMQLLRTGHIDLAFVGAVDLSFEARNLLALHRRGATLPQGEGAVVLLVKTEARARLDGDEILASFDDEQLDSLFSNSGTKAPQPHFGAVSDLVQVATTLATPARHQPAAGPNRGAVSDPRFNRAVPTQRRCGLFLVHSATERRSLLSRLGTFTGSIDDLARQWASESAAATINTPMAIVAESVQSLKAQLQANPKPAPPAVGKVAFVFPGSGSHYQGMGTGLRLAMPQVYQDIEAESPLAARYYQPGWESTGRGVLLAHVGHGIAVSDALQRLGIRPDAWIGYSLGESTALLASRTWRERDVLCQRVEASPLFRTQLLGDYSVMRQAWGGQARWKAVLVPKDKTQAAACLVGHTALLIVNAPNECVIGGDAPDVDATVRALGVTAIEIEAVPSVHLPLVDAVSEAYRTLHTLPTTPPSGATFYSGAWSRAYHPTPESCAQSILDNATQGFNFEATILAAYADGVSTFIEVGPNSSCTRMIGSILKGRPHLALSACQQGKDAFELVVSVARHFAESGYPVDLESIYPRQAALTPSLPTTPIAIGRPDRRRLDARLRLTQPLAQAPMAPQPRKAVVMPIELLSSHAASVAASHETFLRLTAENSRLQLQLLTGNATEMPLAPPVVAFNRDQCLEFGIGKLSNVLGPDFALVDTFPTRVRLPAEPLMLVDRIVSVSGQAKSLQRGRVITEHDVLPGAWYLDGNRAPVSISVEAGQADLFLSSYLGIDFETKGDSVYRLLDAKIVFHRDLPCPGEVIRYDIEIDRFIRQGSTWLFFFRFEGKIEGKPFITMYDGCAGFFSQQQLDSGKGIVHQTQLPPAKVEGHEEYSSLVEPVALSMDAAAVESLRHGDLHGAFGSTFAGKRLHPCLKLPGQRLSLIDRVVELSLVGGAAKLGMVYAESDIRPDEWFLTCHFIDDQVMPGTLMFEASLQTLRVLLLRMGWVIDEGQAGDFGFAPVPGIAGQLKCRGQVTKDTKTVGYRVEIEQVGYSPEPYVIARASMFADGRHVVAMEGMSLRLRGATRRQLEARWPTPTERENTTVTPARSYSKAQILAYAQGKPSEGFGARYQPFDTDRRLARLPRPPFLFLDAVTAVDAEPWQMTPQGWMTGRFELSFDDWFFTANQTETLPYAVLLEAALQPCGWLAAYAGSALLSAEDLHFRNLDGAATQWREVHRKTQYLTTRARMTKASQAGGMILQSFDMEVLDGDALVFSGTTGFGFFPALALKNQVGIRGLTLQPVAIDRSFQLPVTAPMLPRPSGSTIPVGLTLPSNALVMVDRIECLELSGGTHQLGLVRGSKQVDAAEWFFDAHFYQDPVMPGSLGLEAMIQLMKVFARERFPGAVATHRFQSMALGQAHRWQYRGQVIPSNVRVDVEVTIKQVIEGDSPLLVADGLLLVDGRVIYASHDFSLRLVGAAQS
jgi:acyl transferase domain-containing protein/3-hydroxymyristoyl/3-hydroxydecanoyl-(acyl carrier protein) dehydratase